MDEEIFIRANIPSLLSARDVKSEYLLKEFTMFAMLLNGFTKIKGFARIKKHIKYPCINTHR